MSRVELFLPSLQDISVILPNCIAYLVFYTSRLPITIRVIPQKLLPDTMKVAKYHLQIPRVSHVSWLVLSPCIDLETNRIRVNGCLFMEFIFRLI